jgi:hypothetical protein
MNENYRFKDLSINENSVISIINHSKQNIVNSKLDLLIDGRLITIEEN